MGRNNRARRQQKQRKKQRQNTVQKPSNSALRIAEVKQIGEPLITALRCGEPPPPSMMQLWSTLPISNANEGLRQLLIGFVDYLFHKGNATGLLECLTSFKTTIQKTDLHPVYPLLYSYCLISEKSLADGNSDKLVEQLNSASLGHQMGAKDQDKTDMLCAPFYLFFWATEVATANHVRGNVKLWLQDCLYQSPLHRLITPLEKFLKLKAPKPQQKTVITLESVLSQINWDHDQQWREGLGYLLHLFLQQRLTLRQRSKERWTDFPHLSALAGLVETQVAQPWSHIAFESTDTATLNMLDRLVDNESMHYEDRVRLEALKCRILVRYAFPNTITLKDFERQLTVLVNLLSTGIPPAQTDFASHCLDATCEWLADRVSHEQLPDLKVEPLQRIYRQRPHDYRVAVLIYWVTHGRTCVNQNDTVSTYQHIHFDLFFFVFNMTTQPKKFLKNFYWSLAAEVKKDLFIRSCRRVFLQANIDDTYERWRYCQRWLVDAQQDPFDSVLKGHPCEHEFLFYVVIMFVDKPTALNFLQADEITALVRSSADSLTKNASSFNQDHVTRLLNLLSSMPGAVSMFNAWDPVLVIVDRIQDVDELEAFMLIATQALNKEHDRHAVKYRAMHSAIDEVPKARALWRAQSKKATRKRKRPAQSLNLDLFDDIS